MATKTLVRINFRDNGYAPDQIRTCKVWEIKSMLENYDDDDDVCLYCGSDCAHYYSLDADSMDEEQVDEEDLDE